MMKRLSLAALVFALMARTAGAQSAYLVKDINQTAANSPTSSSPYNFFRFGSHVFFAATTRVVGTQLWVTDDTQAGTISLGAGRPSRFVVVNGKLLFDAISATAGEELWISDGTVAGTRLLADINSGLRSSSPGDRIVYRDKLLFSADDGADGGELWITDGTPAGTRLFKDLVPGPTGSGPHGFVLFNGLVYFATPGGLWKTDLTESGTVQVKSSVEVDDLTVVGSHMFFRGYTAAEGGELWVSDGTESGTHIVLDILPGPEFAVAYGSIQPFGDRVLVAAKDSQHGYEIWISDGSVAGTHVLRDINPGRDSSTGPGLKVVTVGGIGFFTAGYPLELWKTDGTEAGTARVSSVILGASGKEAQGLLAVGTKVYFGVRAANLGGGLDLWVLDANTGEAHQFMKQVPGFQVQQAQLNVMVTNLDGILYFAGSNPLNGFEPWKSDGTEAGTSMIANLAADEAPSSHPSDPVAIGDLILFNAWDGTGKTSSNVEGPPSLWRSDGTSEGTFKLSSSAALEPLIVGNSLFFGQPTGLWKTDGTIEGTQPATAMASRFPAAPHFVFAIGQTIFARLESSNDLWTTTASHDARAAALGVAGGFGYTDFDGRLMFFADGGLWTSDGTPAGTFKILSNVNTGFPSNQAVMGGLFYFVNGGKLWRSDGTVDGTAPLSFTPDGVGNLTATGRKLFFLVLGQLWVTDGTESGTHSLPAKTNSVITAAGERVVFTGSDPATGRELWASDGTVDGTHILLDLFPGPNSSDPSEFASGRGRVYFNAFDPQRGHELFGTDGTVAGTSLAADIDPLTDSSPSKIVFAGDRVFFSAFTQATGRELWALPLSSTPQLAINDTRVIETDTGATARFTVSLSPAAAQVVTTDFATADGTAVAGSDYDAASGTLTFAPGETSKNIDVHVRGDSNAENNESFFVTLQNAKGAAVAKPSAFAIIEDDDQTADLSLSLDFSSFDGFEVSGKATNAGPRTASNIKMLVTATPVSNACPLCPAATSQLAPGATGRTFTHRDFGRQLYLSATVSALPRDPQPSNNAVAWTTNTAVAMDALFLTPGSQANVWFVVLAGTAAAVNIESSNPAVISVPASVTIPTPGKPATFVARGVSTGTATIRVFTPATTIGTLTVEVVPAGTKPRWPGGVSIFGDNSAQFDRPLKLRLSADATAPLTAESATGLITISQNGREVARGLLTRSERTVTVAVYPPDVGTVPIKIDYAGDANFLPITSTGNYTIGKGNVTVLGFAERVGTSARIHFRVTGSPVVAPTGTLTVSEAGKVPSTQIPITLSPLGIAEADVTLSNVTAGEHTFLVFYSGDARYNSSAQNVRLIDPRKRAVSR